MNNLAVLRRIILTLFSVLLAANLWGQSDLNGSGTADDPFQIGSAADWDVFAGWINAGYNVDRYYKLINDIPTAEEIAAGTTAVSTMAGDWYGIGHENNKYFQGTFDGNWHTLKFTKGTIANPFEEKCSAPFRLIDGATIKNLAVEGTIVSTQRYMGGIVAWSNNTNGAANIINCISSIEINCSQIGNTNETGDKQRDCSAAGFIGQINKGSVNFENCIFNGNILKGTQDKANRSAGFVSYIDNYAGTINYKNCTMAGVIDFDYYVTNYKSTFNRNERNKFDFANCKSYYINNYGGLPASTTYCDQALTTKPDEAISRKYTVNRTDYYVPGTEITGLEAMTYSCTGSDIVITPTLKYYGWTLTKDTDYAVSYKKKNGEVWEDASAINAAGDYKFIISGIGEYDGSVTTDIKVINTNSWSALKEALADNTLGKRNITLNSNVTPTNPVSEGPLEVNGIVVLNLNGKTLNRNLTDTIVRGQVIRVNSEANLTINGSGTITGGKNRAENSTAYGENNEGGGIYNMGSLVLNNVNVNSNLCVKETKNSESSTARGGGIYSGEGSSLIINNGNINYNVSGGGGGGVFTYKASAFKMKGVTVMLNESGSKGGGLRMQNEFSVSKADTIQSCMFMGNKVTESASNGGGIHMESGKLYMENCDVIYNQSRQQGCGFYSLSGTTYAKNCHFDENLNWNDEYDDVTENKGGGICVYAGTFTMDGGTVMGNACNNNGGAVYVHSGHGGKFQVLGNVQIVDNRLVQFVLGAPPVINNFYLANGNVIRVIGPLGDDAIINITPNGTNTTYVEFADGTHTDPEHPEDDLRHFVLDDNSGSNTYSLIVDESGNIEVYTTFIWNEPTTWNGIAGGELGHIPTESDDITINRAIKIPSDCTAVAGDITLGTYGSIILEEGGQLKNNNTVNVLTKKNVVKAYSYEDEATGWYLISSPVDDPNIENNTNLLTTMYYNNTYDLYRFNEAAELQWENYRNQGEHPDFTTLQNGRGYLYRNGSNHTIEIEGKLNVADLTCNLSCNGEELRGFNLIGNPYSQNITLLNTTLVDDEDYQITRMIEEVETPINLACFYRLTADGSIWTAEITSGDEATIAPLEGFLVQVPEAAKKVKFSKTPRAAKRSNGGNIKFTVANSQYEDVAYALFENGLGLNKIEHMNENVPMVYINRNEKRFAVATMSNETKQFNLNLEAKTMGQYTLSYEANGNYKYLHLIDKLAAKDIDLLEEKEYSFIASSIDKADRFIVRLGYMNDDSSNTDFAYQNGNEIIISGDGELQIFDVMGRMVYTQRINGIETVSTSLVQTGVYIMKLNDKTQKIIIK